MLAKATQRTPEEVQSELGDVWVVEGEDISQRKEPITFWAHDDSPAGGCRYQYRIRIGVFNPIAGQNWVYEDQQNLNEQVILWSDYSEPTDPVLIEEMIHFFPLSAKVNEDNTDSVDVQVSKYFLGRWRSETFNLKSGEPIGWVMENDSVVTSLNPGTGRDGREDYGSRGISSVEPTEIDYGTGNVLVDVVDCSDWQGPGSLKRRQFKEILHTPDGALLEHLAIDSRYWPDQIAAAYDNVKQDEIKGPFPYIAFAANTSMREKSIQQRNSYREQMMNEYNRMDPGNPRGIRDAGGSAIRRRP
jgi:hypothetical protein